MDLSEYILEPLREDEDLTLYRGRHQRGDRSERPTILLMAPMPLHPESSRLGQDGHENPLRSALGTASDLRPISVAQYGGQAVLVFENPGDELLDAPVLNSIKTGHLLRIALKKAFEEIGRPDNRLASDNRVVRERVDQSARLLSEQKPVSSEFDQSIAERTRELVETNEDLQLQAGLLQHLPVSAWTLKPDGTPDFLNQVWLEFSGQTLDFVRSHPEAWMTAVHPDDREKAARAFWDGVRSGQGFSFETRSRRAEDGTYRWHLQQAVVLRDAEGKVLRFVGTTTDIHDQKLAEEALRASEGNLRRVIDTIPTLSWCNLADGPNEFLSKSWHDYTGMSPEEARGWGWSTAFHPDDLPPLMKRWRELLVSGEPGEIEARLRRHDGEYRWFLIRVAPFRDESGTILRWYGTSTDIHDRKRAEEQLTRARTELAHVARVTGLGVLAASIAHEVNQPLSGIVMNAGTCLRMLDSDPPNIGGARDTARRTIRDGNRASEVVTRLRALFKTKEVTAEWVNLNDAAQEVIALSLSELQSKRIIVLQEFAENLPSVKGDRIQLQQVIQNLLRNASDSMSGIDDRPRQLVIRTESEDAKNVQVIVQDTGIGIAPETAERLFDPFYTTKEDGTGIGLSVSRSIVEAHRGRIWATTNDGPGTSFIFSIPCDPGSLQSQDQ